MKQSSAANIAIGLMVIGWAAASFGVLRQLGDAAPWVTQQELLVHARMSKALVFGGVLAILSALWLSGFGYPAAPKRSILVIAGCFGPSIVLYYFSFFSG